jgi:hypothetical protein
MTKIQQTEIRWNVTSQDNPQIYDWMFLITARPESIDRIVEKFEEHALPTEEKQRVNYGQVNDTRTECEFIRIRSHTKGPHNIEWRKVYAGEGTIKRDCELYDRQRPEGLDIYIQSVLDQKTKRSGTSLPKQ